MDGGSEEWGSFLSKMNVMDNLGRMMELQSERKEHSSILCLCAYIAIPLGNSNVIMD